MTSPAGTSSASWLDNGWQWTRSLPNGVGTTYGYKANGVPSSLLNQTAGASTLSVYGAFAYDGVFNLTGLAASVPGATSLGGSLTFGYDSKDRLTSEAAPRYGSHAFGYDAAGNPTAFKGTAQGFDADNRQTSGGGTFVYDGNGNPTTYRGTALGFDPECRATAVGSTFAAGYRADGLRGWKSVSGVKTYCLYDGGEPVVELSATGAVTAVNVFAPDGLVARSQGGTWTQYAFDPQGSVSQRLSGTGTVLSSSAYDAYGVESNSGGTPTDPFGYNARSGYLLDRETGLYLCGHRYYDAGAGRWLTRDPIGAAGGIDVYAYCGGSPLGWIDPSGYGEEGAFRKVIEWYENGAWRMRPGNAISESAARNVRKSGGNVLAPSERAAEDLDNSVSGGRSWRDDPHPNRSDDTPNVDPKPHYQNNCVKGHTFFNLAAALAYLLLPAELGVLSDAADAGEAFGRNVVDPYVKDKQGKREKALH